MRVLVLVASLFATASIQAAPAQAKVVFVRINPTAPELGDAGDIVVARNDGSSPKEIASGSHPVIAPDGRHVAYFTHKARGGFKLRIVPTKGGSSRVLLPDSFPPGAAPLAWSHNSRYIAAAGAGPTGTVVDTRTGKRLLTVELDFQFDGASFSPDDADIMFDNGSERGTSLLLAHTHKKGVRTLRSGARAVWVQRGIFFASGGGIQMRRRPRSSTQVAYRGHGTPTLFTVGASADAQTVLVAEGPSFYEVSPVLITSKSNAARTIPAVFSEIDGVSRHGKSVLGVANGNVVVAAADDGATRVIATDAISPSWTG